MSKREPTREELLAFIQRWRDIIDGDSKTAEPWARDFEIELRALFGSGAITPTTLKIGSREVMKAVKRGKRGPQ